MPQYDVTAPTGQTFTVTAPAGASEAEILAYAQAQFAAMESKRSQEQEAIRNAPAEETGMVDAAMIGAGREMTQLGRGVKDLFVDPSKQDLADRKFEAEAFDRLRRARPVSTAVGESLPGMAAGGMAGAGRGVLGAMGRQALAGGAVAAAKPGTMEERAQAGLTEGALAGGLTGVVGGLGRVGQQALRPEVTALREAGVTPTVGQTIGGAANRSEEKLASLPIIGDFISNARNRAMNEWRGAELRRIPDAVGGNLSRTAMDDVGHAGINEAHKMVDDAYEYARSLAPGGIVMDQVADAEMVNLRNMLRNATKENQDSVERFLKNNLGRRRGPSAGFEVNNFQQLDADLSKQIRETIDPQRKSAFQEVQRILQDAAGRVNPAYSAAQRDARTGFARLAAIEAASNAAPAQLGRFTPGQLLRARKMADASARHNQAARGAAPGQNLTAAGQEVLGNKVPDSGTFGRMALGGGAAGGLGATGALFDPVTLGLIGGAGIGSTRAGQGAANATLRGLGHAAPNIPPWLSQMLDVEEDQP